MPCPCKLPAAPPSPRGVVAVRGTALPPVCITASDGQMSGCCETHGRTLARPQVQLLKLASCVPRMAGWVGPLRRHELADRSAAAGCLCAAVKRGGAVQRAGDRDRDRRPALVPALPARQRPRRRPGRRRRGAQPQGHALGGALRHHYLVGAHEWDALGCPGPWLHSSMEKCDGLHRKRGSRTVPLQCGSSCAEYSGLFLRTPDIVLLHPYFTASLKHACCA